MPCCQVTSVSIVRSRLLHPLMILILLLIKGSTIGSKTNPSGANRTPSFGIGILLNLSISRGLMPTLFVGQSHGECQNHVPK
jgi:hypothetical protein